MRFPLGAVLLVVTACSGSGDPPTDTTPTETGDTGTTSPTGDTGTPAPTGDTGPRTCDAIEADFWAEAQAIQSCSEASECGQVLTGTSCGCTRDWVARNDADVTAFYDLVAEGQALECELVPASVCDCPPADGFDCVEGTCAWNYVDSDPYLPVCFEADGDAFTIDLVSLDGDDLVVEVGYSGGCQEHDFELCWPDQVFMESYPVQAQLELWHDDHDDACDAWLYEELRFDLGVMEQAFTDSYGSTTGTITLHLGGFTVDHIF